MSSGSEDYNPSTPEDIDISRNSLAEDLKTSDMEHLKELLEEAVKNEDYEKASQIRDEIKRRKKS